MKPNHKVFAVLIFGLVMTMIIPSLTNIAYQAQEITYQTKQKSLTNNEIVNSISEAHDKASNIEVAVATPVVIEPEVIEEPKIEVKEPEPINPALVYDGMTLEQLTQKLNRSLKSDLAGTGGSFAKYALENNIDVYLAVAIVLHETGCNWNCSTQVKQCNNVGGMKGGSNTKCNGGSYSSFATLDEGIRAFTSNLKRNYYDKGLNTPELMNSKYAASTAWAGKINDYIKKLKNS